MHTLPDFLQKTFDQVFFNFNQERAAFAPQMMPHDVDVAESNRDVRNYFPTVERIESESESESEDILL